MMLTYINSSLVYSINDNLVNSIHQILNIKEKNNIISQNNIIKKKLVIYL